MSRLTIPGVLGPRGLLAEALSGWESRPSQLEMAGAVAAALRDRRPLLVEAGTGTGKTLAYLVPALLSGMKVVVSTGTKNLQEQILKKDVPLLERALPLSFRVAALKGISNYLCLRRAGEHLAQLAAFPDDPVASELERLREWARGTATGDRAELAGLPDDAPVWREVSATSETRLGARCPHFEACFVTGARRAAHAADLLVVNHHLFFADLALRAQWPQAQLLPAYEAVIFDEAHQIEDVATDYFSVTVSTLRLAGVVRDLRRAVSASQLDEKLDRTAAHLEAVGADLFGGLRARLPRDGRAPLTGDTFRGDATRDWHRLDAALEELEGAAGAAHTDGAEAEEVRAGLQRRARALRDDLAFIADGSGGTASAAEQRGRVFWGETRGRTVLLHASPVDVSELLRERVVAPIEAVVFTSATLTTGGSFDYVRSRLGLDHADATRLAAPFDYARQALLYLPRDLPEPSAPAFAEAAADRIDALVQASRGRAFLLFTSHRQMLAVHRLVAHRIDGPVLVQGERPKHQLLDEFKRRPSVLFATASFWEGVDVVGDALQLVVIDKLPFAPPDDPLVSARCRLLEESGGDPFGGYQVPEAALALAQGFGRLIRHRGDRGVVALLDRRATTRAYGRGVLAGLPAECPRTDDLDRVRRFFQELRVARASS